MLVSGALRLSAAKVVNLDDSGKYFLSEDRMVSCICVLACPVRVC